MSDKPGHSLATRSDTLSSTSHYKKGAHRYTTPVCRPFGDLMDLFDHMSDHTGVVHSCAPFLEHMRDHLSADHLT